MCKSLTCVANIGCKKNIVHFCHGMLLLLLNFMTYRATFVHVFLCSCNIHHIISYVKINVKLR